MRRIQELEKQLIAKKQTLNFEHFANSSTLDRQNFIQNIFGPNWRWRDFMYDIIRNNQDMFPHFHLMGVDRKQIRRTSGELIFKIREKVTMTLEEYLSDPNKLTVLSVATISYNMGFSVKNGVHLFLYMKTLYNLGTQKHKPFLEAASKYQDVGCFGLTELLHGSNIKDLQTEAHYDHAKKQFVINSPTKDAMKFWIGAAAELANVSVIWAQLYIDGKCFGIHAFIVPLRDKKTHKLLPGVLVGDCGPKNGCNQIDNGFILFDNFRIPSSNLLDKISGINENGVFFSTVEGEDKRFGTHLATLSGGRFMVSINSSTMALDALAIAARYSCVRRQFSTGANETENLLMEYPLTQRRIMPLMAQAVIYQLGNMSIAAVWDNNLQKILDPKNNVIQDLHAISSTIKPKSGWFATEVIKQARQLLGGHGYSYFSKLAVMYNNNDINNTWEGDNNVLYQQATKYVLDNAQKAMKGKKISSPYLEFLADPPSDSDISFDAEKLMDPNFGTTFLRYKIFCKVQDMGMKMLGLKQQKMPLLDIWNNSQVFLGKTIALAFGDLYYLNNALEKLKDFSDKNRIIMNKIIVLWLLRIYRYDQFVDSVHHPLIEDLMGKLCRELTGECLGILQAICPDDLVMGSPFACPKGEGFAKYIKLVRSSNVENKRVEWWEMLKK